MERINKLKRLLIYKMFKCFHCGACCDNPATQIGLTVGDVVRLAKSSGMTIKQLFEKHIGIVPFPTDDENIYEMDLGLQIPCYFRENGKCSNYYGRPLNCRLFPLWMMVEYGKKADDILNEMNKCRGQRLEGKELEKTKKYVMMIKSLLMNETRLTEELMNGLGLKEKVDIRKLEGYEGLKKRVEEVRKTAMGEGAKRKAAEAEKINFIKKHKRAEAGRVIEEEIMKRGLDKRIMPLNEMQFAENVMKGE